MVNLHTHISYNYKFDIHISRRACTTFKGGFQGLNGDRFDKYIVDSGFHKFSDVIWQCIASNCKYWP